MAKGWHFTSEQLERLRKSHQGLKLSEEQKKRIGLGSKKAWDNDPQRKIELSMRLSERHSIEKESNKLNPLQKYILEHPEHQSKAGKRGGRATIDKYGKEHMKKAYQTLTDDLRRRHKQIHDNAVKDYVEKLQAEGATIILTDLKGVARPDIVYYKEGGVYLIDIKTGNHKVRIINEGEIPIPSYPQERGR